MKQGERIAALEAQVKTLPESIQRIDNRLRKLEWIAACGVGALGVLQVVLTKWG